MPTGSRIASRLLDVRLTSPRVWLMRDGDLSVSLLARAILLPVNTAITLASTRLSVAALGVDGFAVLALVSGLLLLMPFADLGVGAHVTNVVARYRAKAIDRVLMLEELSAASRVQRVTAMLLVGVSCGLSVGHAWPSLLGYSRVAMGMWTDWAPTIIVAAFAFSLALGFSQRILIGAGKNSQTVICGSVQPVAAGLFTIGAALMAKSIVWYFAAIALAIALASAATTVLAVRVLHLSSQEFLGILCRWRGLQHSSVWHIAAPMLIITATSPVLYQSGRLVLSHYSTLGAVAQFALVNVILTTGVSVVSAAGGALWGKYAHLRATADQARLRQSWISALRYMALVGGLMALVVAIGGRFMSNFMGGGRVRASEVMFILVAAIIFAQSIHLASGMYLTDARGLSFQAKWAVAASLFMILISSLLSSRLGAFAPLLTLVGCLTIFQLIPAYLRVRVELRNG